MYNENALIFNIDLTEICNRLSSTENRPLNDITIMK